jgi:hypothetical protein
MKRKLAFAVVIGLFCAPALVLGGSGLSLYSDVTLTNCALSDQAAGTATVYVAEQSNDGATGIRFRIVGNSGFTGVWLSDSTPYVTVGNSQTDLSMGYGVCLLGKFPVLTVTYQLFGTSTCSLLEIAPAQGFPVSLCISCSFNETPCIGNHALHVNCPGPFDCNPVAAEPSTWGRVKSLYRD